MYKDVALGNDTYRGVYFTSYRPYYTNNSSDVDSTDQDDNNYKTDTVYWFKYEPIQWRILAEQSGKAYLLCEMLIDSQDYNDTTSTRTINGTKVYGNNYEHSSIRAWLNDNFYNTAFADYEKALIQLTTVDNSAASTGNTSNSYACNNTEDSIFLPSYQDMVNTSYGFDSDDSAYDTARQKKTTDYAQCQGAYTNSGSTYTGNGRWYLRSPSDRLDGALEVYLSGYADYDYSIYIYSTCFGVCPALWIAL